MKDGSVTNQSADQLVYLDISLIVPSKTNPRTTFNDKEIEDLSKSIKQVGLINAVTVRPHNLVDGRNTDPEHVTFEIVAGEKRYRACKLAGLTKIKAEVRDLTDDQVLEIQIIENLHRSDVHPMDEANGYKALLDTGKYDVKSICQKIGKSETYIHDRLTLLKLHKDIQKSYRNNEILLGHALLLSKLQYDTQLKGLDYVLYCDWGNHKKREVIETVKELRNWIDNHVIMNLKKVSFNTDDEKLVPSAGSCTNCSKRTGYNKMLFPDLVKSDSCTDPLCFGKKKIAHIGNAIKKLKKEQDTVPIVSDNYLHTEFPDKSILFTPQYIKVQKGFECANTIKAVIAEDYDSSKVGKVIKICMQKDCPVHKRTSSSSSGRSLPSPMERYKRKLELIHQPEVLDQVGAISKNIFSSPLDVQKSNEYLRTIIYQFLFKIDWGTREFILKTFTGIITGNITSTSSYDNQKERHQPNKYIDQFLSGLDTNGLFNFLFCISLISHLEMNLEYLHKSSELKWFMEYTGSIIDIKPIIDEVAKNKYDALREKAKKSFIKNQGYDPDEGKPKSVKADTKPGEQKNKTNKKSKKVNDED